jgi:bifunctional N-acetylglucosamine-1-phosphate-uridyltransferase/glucosamine-1-phosphate-acetyltransferase GlmU-like protein
VVVLCGDTPLIKAATVRRLVDTHESGENDLTLLTTRLANPSGYGRIIVDKEGRLIRIVEEADATETEKRVGIVNTGTYCIHMPFLGKALADLKNDNAQGEFYLTDVVEQAYRTGRSAVMLEIDASAEVIGVNTRGELAEAERLLARALEQGA